MGQITHEDLNVKLSEEIKESARLSEINQGKIKEQEEKTASLPELQSDFTEHVAQIASTEKLGHIKVDGTTISVDPITGIASSKGVEIKEYIGDLNNLIEDGQYESPISTLNAPSTTKHLIHVQSSIDKSAVIQTAISIATSGNRQTYRRTGHKSGGVYVWAVDTNPGSLNGWKIEDISLSDSLTSTNMHQAATANAVKQVNDKLSNIPRGLNLSSHFIEEFTGQVGIIKSGSVAVFFFDSKNTKELSTNNKYLLCEEFPKGYKNLRAKAVGSLFCMVGGTIRYLPVVIEDGVASIRNVPINVPLGTKIEGQISFFAE